MEGRLLSRRLERSVSLRDPCSLGQRAQVPVRWVKGVSWKRYPPPTQSWLVKDLSHQSSERMLARSVLGLVRVYFVGMVFVLLFFF